MKEVTNDKECLEALKKAKKGETILFDERKKDIFEISFGNKRVLELIPSMMEDEGYRKKLRLIAIEFSMTHSRFPTKLFKKELKQIKKSYEKYL